jgi:hypothetical protein
MSRISLATRSTAARTANWANMAVAIARTASNSEPTRTRRASNQPDAIMEEEWIRRTSSLPKQRRGGVGVQQSSWNGTPVPAFYQTTLLSPCRHPTRSDKAKTRKEGGGGGVGGAGGGIGGGTVHGIRDVQRAAERVAAAGGGLALPHSG